MPSGNVEIYNPHSRSPALVLTEVNPARTLIARVSGCMMRHAASQLSFRDRRDKEAPLA